MNRRGLRLPRLLFVVTLFAASAGGLGAAPAWARPYLPHTTAVSVKLTRKPAKFVRSTGASFAWSIGGRARSITCKLDGHAARPCTKRRIAYKGLTEGHHTFLLTVRGSRTRRLKFSWVVDHTVPVAPTSVTGGSSTWTTTAPTLTASGGSDAGSGLLGYQYHVSTDGGATWTAPVLRNPARISVPGADIVQFRSVDRAGNTSAWAPVSASPANTVDLDVGDPQSPVVAGGSPVWQNVPSVDVTASGTADSGASGWDHYGYRLSTDGGGSWSPEATGALVTVSAEGTTLVEFRSHDLAGNVSGWVTTSVNIDRAPPTDPIVTGGSATWQDVDSVHVAASGSTDTGSGLSGYQRETSTDGGLTWSTAASAAGMTVTAQGETLVRFRAADVSSQFSNWVTATVRIDTTAPAPPSVSGGSAAWQNAASVDVTASGTADTGGSGWDHYGYRVSTDGGGTWSPEAPGGLVTVSAEGTTLVKYRSYDLAGNMSAWVIATVNIDRAAPTDPIVTGSSAAWQDVDSMHVSAAGSTDTGSGLDGYQRQVSTDGGVTWGPATMAASMTVTAEGEKLVRFRALDVSGQASNWVTATVRIDRTAPAAPTVGGGSASWLHTAPVAVTASGTADTGGSGWDHYGYRVSTDGGNSWSPEAVGNLVSVSADGTTMVKFRSYDAAGNTSGWTTATVNLDATAPTDPAVTGGSSTWQDVASIALAAGGSTDSGSGLAGYQRQISTDGGLTWGATSTSGTRTVTAEGETLVRFRAFDASGLTSNWVTGTARIDRTAPAAPSLSGALAGWQNVAQETVTPSSTDSGGSGLASYQYETSTSGAWSAPTTAVSAVIAGEGVTSVRLRAVDGAGNPSGWTATTVMIDRTAPTDPAVSGGSSSWQSVPSVTVTASSSTDAASGVAGYLYQTSIDNGLTWSPAAPGSSVPVSAEGQTLVRFQAVDNASIPSGWVQATVRIDRTLPTAPVVSGGSLSWQNVASVTVSGAGSADPGGSGIAGYQTRTSTDGGLNWSVPAAGASAPVSAEGSTLVQVRALDNAGNPSSWAPAVNGATNTVNLDRTDPTAPALAGGSATWTNVAPIVISAGGGTDAGSGVARYEYQVSTNGGAWAPVTPTPGATASIATPGDSTVRFRTVDNVGRVSGWVTAQARLDTAAPSAPAVSGGSLSWQNVAQIVISASGSTDPANGSGFFGYQYHTSTNGGASWSVVAAGASVPVTAQGTTLVQFRSVDNAGNASAWTPAAPGASNTAKIDTVAPTAPTVTGGAGAGTCYRKHTGSASGSTDASSGLNRYEYRYSSDNGVTWSATATGSSFQFTTRGVYVIQFRAVDNVGLFSAWAPVTAGTQNTICIR